MLFVIDTNGVPSVASIVRVSTAGDATAADRADEPDRDGRVGSGRAELGGGDGRRRHRALQRPPRHDRRLHAERREPDRPADRDDATSTPASPPGTYYYRVTAEDVAGNIGPASNQASAVVPAGAAGLVAAYGFDEGAGTTTADQSGNANNGTLSDATWSATGKFGKALSFNGTTHGHSPRLERARPDDRDDARGLGAAHAVGDWQHADREGAARATSSTGSTRARTPTGPSRRSRSAARAAAQRRRLPPARGRTSPRPTTGPPSGSS